MKSVRGPHQCTARRCPHSARNRGTLANCRFVGQLRCRRIVISRVIPAKAGTEESRSPVDLAPSIPALAGMTQGRNPHSLRSRRPAMPTPHNSAKPGDYAEAVLLPGDPLRARWVAETFLKDARQVNAVRNCLGYTGTWNGCPVSVQATGM